MSHKYPEWLTREAYEKLQEQLAMAVRTLQYFSETGIWTRANEDGEWVEITYMADDVLKGHEAPKEKV